MERTERRREGLLDYLADKSGCAYLSDLRIPSSSARLEQVLQGTPWGVWTAEAWQEAANYITGKDSGTGEAEAREILIAWCRNCQCRTRED
ncbi:hypothetical protein [uncultured Pseudoflavonifractor sp.]|uniref:hypothetical protein n=1 Tax=uncultured Pseudoflavonifractor sp. TaxID=1221379 RepID=UPI0025D6FC95|nr:hypothetical protein [uncultured Pseudoflavonifractor sp.]